MKVKFLVRTDDDVRIYGTVREALDATRQYLVEVYHPQLRKMAQIVERTQFQSGEIWMFYNSEIDKDTIDNSKVRAVTLSVCEEVS